MGFHSENFVLDIEVAGGEKKKKQDGRIKVKSSKSRMYDVWPESRGH